MTRTSDRRAVLLGAAAALAAGPALARAAVGQRAPHFTLFTFEHKKITSAELAGKVVVLNFWATWCAPCRAELLVLEDYLRGHPGTGLRIFAIDVESDRPMIALRRLAALLSFPLIDMMQGSGYGTINGAVPTSYVIDRMGVVRYASAGAFTPESFDATVAPLLAAPAPPAASAPRGV